MVQSVVRIDMFMVRDILSGGVEYSYSTTAYGYNLNYRNVSFEGYAKLSYIYDNYLCSRFVNDFVKRGLKEIIVMFHKNICYNPKLTDIRDIPIFLICLMKVLKMAVQIRHIRIGGRVYAIPFLVKIGRQEKVAFKLIRNKFLSGLKNINGRYSKLMGFQELLLIFKQQTVFRSHIRSSYETIYDKRAFSHYRWF